MMRAKQMIAFFLLLLVSAALGGCSREDNFLEDISFTLPDGVAPLDYREETGPRGGCLLSPKLYDGGDGTPDEWIYSGMIARFPAERAVWKDGGITGVTGLWNHTDILQSRSLDGLAAPAFALEAEHDLYTAAGLYALEESGGSLDGLRTISTYWYVFFARPEDEWGYVLSLNAECFSEDDMLQFAESFQY